MKPIFYEVTPSPLWQKILGGSIVCLAVAGVIPLILQVKGNGLLVWEILLIFFVVAFAGYSLVFARICVQVDNSGLTMKFFPIWKKSISFDDISSVCVDKIFPAQFGGVGIRKIPGRGTALLFSGGEAVKIACKSTDGRFYAIRTNRPVELSNSIQSKTSF